jgi:hypothetical protein
MKNRQIIHQKKYISLDGTSAVYLKQIFRIYDEIKYFVEISRRRASYLCPEPYKSRFSKMC